MVFSAKSLPHPLQQAVLWQEIGLAGEQRQRHRYAFAAEKPHGGVNQRIWSAVQPLSAPCEVGGITTKPYSKIQKERFLNRFCIDK